MEGQRVLFLACTLKIRVRAVPDGQDTETHTFDHLDFVVVSRDMLTKRWIAFSHPDIAMKNYTVYDY